MSDTTALKHLATQLADADRNGRRLISAELIIPETMTEAINVQTDTLSINGWTLGGFKLGIRPDGTSIAAPLGRVVHASESGSAGFEHPVLDALEVEICFLPIRDLPLTGPDGYTRESLVAELAIYSGVEFLTQRLDLASKSPPLLFLADRMGNSGYVLGEPLTDDFLEPGLDIPLSIRVNGDSIFDGPGKHPNVDPLAPLLAYVNATHNAGSTLGKGQIFTTGSLCGALPLPARAAIAIDGFTTLTITATATAGE